MKTKLTGTKTDWESATRLLLKTYRNKPHPLEYQNIYQLVVMVILSAQSSDALINQIAPSFFKQYPDIEALSHANEADLQGLLIKVRNFGNKSKWLIEMAKLIKKDDRIPLTMDGLTNLPGIGRKSANVILRGAGKNPEGVIVDLHVLRVAPRIGIATGTDPKKIEKQLMEVIPQKDWAEIGMAISFLGREICRPTNPKHEACVMAPFCEFVQKQKK